MQEPINGKAYSRTSPKNPGQRNPARTNPFSLSHSRHPIRPPSRIQSRIRTTQKSQTWNRFLNRLGGAAEPILTLAQTYGSAGDGKSGGDPAGEQIVFHSVGDTGSVIGPDTQSLVADKMVSDFDEANSADVPSFFFHLGDVVYYFGEATYYYDQFYEPFRNYPAPIVAIPGNHDGVVYATDPAPTLEAFLRNFCAANPATSPDAGMLVRTTMIQPGVYFTFDAPFVRILGLYSNVLEDPGVISSQGGTNSLDDRQITFLTTALKRIKSEKYAGAVIIAVHHPPFTGGSVHGGSPQMLADIDSACKAAGVWPHAVFSGHAHNYQRYTRTVQRHADSVSRGWMRRPFPALSHARNVSALPQNRRHVDARELRRHRLRLHADRGQCADNDHRVSSGEPTAG